MPSPSTSLMRCLRARWPSRTSRHAAAMSSSLRGSATVSPKISRVSTGALVASKLAASASCPPTSAPTAADSVRARAVADRVELGLARLAVAAPEDGGRAELDHREHLARRERLDVVVRRARRAVGAVDDLREVELLLRALQHALLGRAARDEPIHVDGLALAEPVHARHRLHVGLRVPVRVEEDAGVGRLQVDSEPPARVVMRKRNVRERAR